MLTSSRAIGLVGVVVLVTSAWLFATAAAEDTKQGFRFTARAQSKERGPFVTEQRPVDWPGNETALLIVDMWDKHWCAGATRRSTAIAPRINELARAVRGRGGLVVHAPSDTMKFYEGTPQRELAKAAPKATPPTPVRGWRHLDLTCEAPLPIDDTDGGCDCEPQCAQPTGGKYPWTREHPLIEPAPGDAVSQDGQEVFNLFRQRGIRHVIVCGVHLNMCVLGRTFAIRQLNEWGFDIVLARDLTDTMYNPRQRPFVDHDKGTQLVIQHVERYWCPTTTSDELLHAKRD
jgi:nicotinamidase-related amidase